MKTIINIPSHYKTIIQDAIAHYQNYVDKLDNDSQENNDLAFDLYACKGIMMQNTMIDMNLDNGDFINACNVDIPMCIHEEILKVNNITVNTLLDYDHIIYRYTKFIDGEMELTNIKSGEKIRVCASLVIDGEIDVIEF